MSGDGGGNGGGSSDKERAEHYQRTGEYTPRGEDIKYRSEDRESRSAGRPGYDPSGPTVQVQTPQGEILSGEKPVNIEYAQAETSTPMQKALYVASGGMIGSMGRMFQPIYRDQPLESRTAPEGHSDRVEQNQAVGIGGTSVAPTTPEPEVPVIPEGQEVQLEGVAEPQETGEPGVDVGFEEMRIVDPMFSQVAGATNRPSLFLGGPINVR